jgi:hypothetical protein
MNERLTIEWRLYLGGKSTGIVVRPDEKYPSLFRVHWPDRPPSDMVNLTRAKDAAMRWAGRGGGGDAKRLHWKAPKQAWEAAPVRLNGAPCPGDPSFSQLVLDPPRRAPGDGEPPQ